MSMLSIQIAKLRKTAESIDWEIPEAAELLREAADTIEDLRDRLQNQAFALGMQDALGSGTCEYKPMWNDDDLLTGEYVGMWYTGCGDALVWNADNDECCKPPAFCPYCGGAVKVVSA